MRRRSDSHAGSRLYKTVGVAFQVPNLRVVPGCKPIIRTGDEKSNHAIVIVGTSDVNSAVY